MYTTRGQPRPIKELAQHLKNILAYKREHGMTDKDHVNMPRNQVDIVLGTITDSRCRLERQEAFESEERYRDAGIKLANERNERTKKGTMCELFQDPLPHKRNDLVNQRIDMVYCGQCLTQTKKIQKYNGAKD